MEDPVLILVWSISGPKNSKHAETQFQKLLCYFVSGGMSYMGSGGKEGLPGNEEVTAGAARSQLARSAENSQLAQAGRRTSM